MDAEGRDLLERHNPILVLFPQEPHTRRRPGARRPGLVGWGDYHPCSAEFFLARVRLRDRAKSHDLGGLIRRAWWRAERTGLEALRQKLANVDPAATATWELDLAEIPSQNEARAWKTYRRLLQEKDAPYGCVAYGRYVLGSSGRALQYWYLYIYNDFQNNHEADWESVVIELGPDGTPAEIGVSCHQRGYHRSWASAPKHGDRPLVFVARGSHGGYFRYRPEGYSPLELLRTANVPAAARFLSPTWRGRATLRGWLDHPPADPLLHPTAPVHDKGTRVEPELRVFPNVPEAGDPAWWWLADHGTWGSAQTRFMGSVGVDSPWGARGQTERWGDPVGWLRSLRDSEPG